MADEILSASEHVTSYANRIPRPDRNLRSSSRSDRSTDHEDAEYTRYSSLDSLGLVEFASSVPLPDRDSSSSSRANRSAEPEDATLKRQTSLDALERVPLIVSETAPNTPAALTPTLSPTQHGNPPGDTARHEQSTNSRGRESIGSNVQNDSDQRALPSFAEKIREMQLCLPHLQNVRYPSRRRDASIDCYDFSNDSVISSWHAGFRMALDGFFADDDTPLSSLLNEQPESGVDLRLILAEDLSSDLIEQLGSLLDISPEIFEEHLLNSGWIDGVQFHQGEESWNTHTMDKDYLTVKWYRPVNRQLLKPNTYEERLKLLDPNLRQPWFSWAENVIDDFGNRHTVRHSSRPISNIIRNNWDIHADIFESQGSSKTVAWEEQTTIWSQKRGSYRIGMSIQGFSLPLLMNDTPFQSSYF